MEIGMEDFKRPNHNDFATSSELKEKRFCGIRHNSLTDEQELWVVGEVVLAVSVVAMLRDPTLWHRKYEDVFALKHVENKEGN